MKTYSYFLNSFKTYFLFKGNWAEPFAKNQTKKADFYINAEKTIQLDFMQDRGEWQFGQSPEMKILSLPYIGKKLSMCFIMPTERFGLLALENSLTGKKLWQIIESTKDHTVDVI